MTPVLLAPLLLLNSLQPLALLSVRQRAPKPAWQWHPALSRSGKRPIDPCFGSRDCPLKKLGHSCHAVILSCAHRQR